MRRVEERDEALLDFLKELSESRLFTTVPQDLEIRLFPAGGFTLVVSLNQVLQDSLRAALVVVVDGGELLRLRTGCGRGRNDRSPNSIEVLAVRGARRHTRARVRVEEHYRRWLLFSRRRLTSFSKCSVP